MQKLYILFFILSTCAWADITQKNTEQSPHEKTVQFQLDGNEINLNNPGLADFLGNMSDAQIAVVNVKGMVCDFCARGIEKTFRKDPSVRKVDVDLSKGKVLIAYEKGSVIDFEDIKKRILSNGQNAIDMEVINL